MFVRVSCVSRLISYLYLSVFHTFVSLAGENVISVAHNLAESSDKIRDCNGM